MVFQDPFSATNPCSAPPTASCGPLRCTAGAQPQQRYEEAQRAFERWGWPPPPRSCKRYPARAVRRPAQRVGFAQALAMRPKLILADEPVSMLDVSIRIGLLNVMADLRGKQGVSVLYITHDIASARYVATG